MMISKAYKRIQRKGSKDQRGKEFRSILSPCPFVPLTLCVNFLLFFCLLVPGISFAQSGNIPNRSKPKPQPPAKPNVPDILELPGPKSGDRQKIPSEPSEEIIRIDSNLVTVIAGIKTATAASQIKLEVADFEIFEDGKLQEIAEFSREDESPLRLVMLFDTSSSVKNQIRFERRAAARFFERILRPQDQAALFAVSTDIFPIQDFTNKPRLLNEATKMLQASGATSLYDGIYLAADYLKKTKGRRIIVIVSDGGDTTSKVKLTEALARAQEADAVIFNVYTGVISNSQNVRDLAAERAMQTLTQQTGGEVYAPQMAMNGNEIDEDQSLKNLDAAFIQLAEQLRTQYTLRYYSTNDARDGKFRKVEVKVKQEGLKAKSRTGYYAAKQ